MRFDSVNLLSALLITGTFTRGEPVEREPRYALVVLEDARPARAAVSPLEPGRTLPRCWRGDC